MTSVVMDMEVEVQSRCHWKAAATSVVIDVEVKVQSQHLSHRSHILTYDIHIKELN